MHLSNIVSEAKIINKRLQISRSDKEASYALAAGTALNKFGFRHFQQWGVTRNLTIDVEGLVYNDRTTLISLVTQCLGKEGAQVLAEKRLVKNEASRQTLIPFPV